MSAGARTHPALVARRRQIARANGRRRRAHGAVVAAGLVAFIVGWWLATGPVLAHRGVSVRGYDGADRAQLVRALEETASGASLLALPHASLRATAMQFPGVKEIAVRRDLPLGVGVDVVPARPIAVAAGDGPPVLVSETGRVLGPAPERAGVGWLRLTGAPPAYGQPLPPATRPALTLLNALPPESSRRLRALRVEGGRMVGRLAGGPRLILGPPKDIALKALALEAVLNHEPAEVERAARYLDLSAPGYPALGE